MLQAKRLAGDAANTDPTWKFLSYWDPEGSEKVCREAHDWMAGNVMSVLPSAIVLRRDSSKALSFEI